jgi:opacity protein-like surface antigen
LSPQFKAQIFSREDLGLELALAGSTHFAFNRAHAFDGVDLNLPFTYQPFETLRLNLNAGWTHAYDDGEQNHRWTWGTGVEYDLARSLTLIAERYGQQGGEQAWQAGPRLHVGERIDVDLVVGRNLTGERDQWLTTGATLRF